MEGRGHLFLSEAERGRGGEGKTLCANKRYPADVERELERKLQQQGDREISPRKKYGHPSFTATFWALVPIAFVQRPSGGNHGTKRQTETTYSRGETLQHVASSKIQRIILSLKGCLWTTRALTLQGWGRLSLQFGTEEEEEKATLGRGQRENRSVVRLGEQS